MMVGELRNELRWYLYAYKLKFHIYGIYGLYYLRTLSLIMIYDYNVSDRVHLPDSITKVYRNQFLTH